MARIALTDDSGKWFSTETAELWKEDTYHNGQNRISKATGSQWEHEGLYRSKGGRFILNKWSDYQGSVETYTEIDKEDAAIWFSVNNHDPLPEIAKQFADLEIK